MRVRGRCIIGHISGYPVRASTSPVGYAGRLPHVKRRRIECWHAVMLEREAEGGSPRRLRGRQQIEILRRFDTKGGSLSRAMIRYSKRAG